MRRDYCPLRSWIPEDVPQLLAMEYELFPENSLSEPMLLKELELGHCYVYDVMGELCGYALARHDGDKLDLTRLGVRAASQRGGIGQRLLHRVLELGLTTVLTVKKTNYGALRLYRRHGFEIVGQLSGYGAWVMRRDCSVGAVQLPGA